MSEDREELKKTTISETDKVTEVRAPGETRILNARNTSAHRWIEKDESLEEVKTRIIPRQVNESEAPSDERVTRVTNADERVTKVANAGSIGSEDRVTRISPDDRTRIEDRSTKIASKKTRIVKRDTEEEHSGARLSAADVSEKAKGAALKIGAGFKQGAADLRKVRVADKGRFARFLRIVAVFVLILLVEIGYFRFEAHVKKMPGEIKETQKELELTQKENELLEEEIEALGDYDSVEELKASWERLKDKVDKAAAGTYY